MVVGFLIMGSAFADLSIVKRVTPRMAEDYIQSIPEAEWTDYVKQHGVSYTYDGGYVSSPSLTGAASTDRSRFAWSYHDQIFYTDISAFRSDNTPSPLCQPNAPQDKALDSMECETVLHQFKECHLFLFNVDRKLIGVQPLHIPQPDYIDAKPSCYEVHAVAPAQVVPDAMLIVISYNDSRWTCNASGPSCYTGNPLYDPDPLYKTTFLIRFSTDESGKIVTRHDDTCLPPLNKYATIASARKALKQAGPACTGAK